MMYSIPFAAVFLLLSTVSAFDSVTVPPPVPVRSIAEFEPMEGMLVIWPLGVPYSLIKEIAKDARVYCVTNNVPVVTSAFTKRGVNMPNVIVIAATPDSASYYVRDFGPLWVTDGSGKVTAIDLAYPANARGNSDLLPIIVGEELGVTVHQMQFFFTGGNFMTDGYGIAASTDLVWKDNFELTKARISALLKSYLGITDYHVIKHPFSLSWAPVEHIDCFAKYLAPDKVAIVKLPKTHSNYASVEAVADYFRSLTSAYGKPYRLYRIFSSGKETEAYLNSTIFNRKVLVPVAGSANDSAALSVYRNAMPGYRVIPFRYDSTQGKAWSSNNALHCRTMGVPDRGMLCIRHVPLPDTVIDRDGNGYPVKAVITAYSCKKLIQDSLKVFYRVMGQKKFSRVSMQRIKGDTFMATIPGVSETSVISYYLRARDLSGRAENAPYMGAEDPFSFIGYSSRSIPGVTK